MNLVPHQYHDLWYNGIFYRLGNVLYDMHLKMAIICQLSTPLSDKERATLLRFAAGFVREALLWLASAFVQVSTRIMPQSSDYGTLQDDTLP